MSGADVGTQAAEHAGAQSGERGLPHLAGLDGIRGLAALAVVLFHAGVSWLPAGFLGVDVFFVVSGFLITALLVSERERSSDTKLTEFWLRRARRLLPVLVLVLIVTTVYAAIMLQESIGQHLHDALMAMLYVTNWDLILRGVSYFEMFERPSQLRHLWSLAVEEQFYIVFPIVFALVMRFLNLRWLWCIVAGLAVLSLIWMVILYTPGDDPSRVYFGSDPRAFTILIGVAVGLFWKPWRSDFSRPLGYAMDLFAVLGLAAIAAIMVVGRHWHDWMYPWGLLLTSLGAITLVAFVVRPGSLVGRLLEVSPLRWLGQRSYSIYLWHWPVLLALQWEFHFAPNTVAIVAVGLAATFALSEISYRLVETPMRRPQFWRPARRPWALGSPRTLAALTAGAAAVAFAALLIAFAVLPGRSPSDLLTAAAAEQSGGEPSILAAPVDEPDAAQQTDSIPARVSEPRRITQPPIRTVKADTDRPAQRLSAADERERPAAERSSAASELELDTTPAAAEPALIAYPPGQYYFSYIVAAGDSPRSIMDRFGMSKEQYIEINGEDALAMIHPGDELSAACPGRAPCALVRFEQIGQGCAVWQSVGEPQRACRSSEFLAELPLRLGSEPSGPLAGDTTWSWSGGRSKGLEFSLRPEHIEESGSVPFVLTVRHGSPPLAIGDSVMVGAQSRLEEVGIEVNAEVGRLAHTSIDILEADRAQNGVRDTVIFQAVGRNFLDANGFQQLIDAAEGVRHLIVLTRQFPPREPLLSYEREINKMLREETVKYDWVTLVDWNEITNGREDEVSWDGTHLNLFGRQLYADHILAAVMSRPPPQFSEIGGHELNGSGGG